MQWQGWQEKALCDIFAQRLFAEVLEFY